MKLIDKDALVAEFNRLITELVEEGEDTMFEQGRISAFEDAKLFINTLEVKEIDTEQLDKLLNWWKEVTTDYSAYKVKEADLNEEVKKYLFNCIDNDGLKPINIAKHFFELGIKAAQKGE